MSLSKGYISSPLEAGTSILDVHHLPPQLVDALEFAAQRLARKSLHVTLLVLRRDYQLPPDARSPGPAAPSPASSVASPPCSPALRRPGTGASVASSSSTSSRLAFAASPVASLKKLVRTGGGGICTTPVSSSSPMASPASPASLSTQRRTGLEAHRFATHGASHPLLRWPIAPTNIASPPSSTPSSSMVPSTAASSTFSDMSGGPTMAGSFCIRLVQVDLLTDRQERFLQQTLERGAKKFGIGTDWLPKPTDPLSCGVSAALVRRSLAQNEVLFASAGLNLVSLDRLYTFKTALACYARTGSPLRLEDAVDELRRLVLSRKRTAGTGIGTAIERKELTRTYEGLEVSENALREVDQMYRRAYGGVDGIGAVDGLEEQTKYEGRVEQSHADKGSESDARSVRHVDFDAHPKPEQTTRATSGERETRGIVGEETHPTEMLISITMDTAHVDKTPSPKAPILKLQTQFDTRSTKRDLGSQPDKTGRDRNAGYEEGDGEDGQLTARPGRDSSYNAQLWSPLSIAEVLGEERRTSQTLGPMTPNGYDDISPVTRGEWGFLMGRGGAQQSARTAAVVMC